MSYLEDGHTYVHVGSVASVQYSTWVEELGDETQLLHSSWWPCLIIPLIMYYIYLNFFCITSFPILFYLTTTDYGFGYCLSDFVLNKFVDGTLGFRFVHTMWYKRVVISPIMTSVLSECPWPWWYIPCYLHFCYLDHNLAM